MLISVIVPALDEAGCIVGTILNLQQLNGEKEIIVVDGGSRDETVALARQHGARVLMAPPGRGVQMHAGAVEARGKVLWFVHADTVVPASALEDIVRALADPGIAGGNFGLIFDGPSRAARQLTAIYPTLRILKLSYGDSGIFVRREIYERTGGFRALALFEDLDFLGRLRREGRFVHLQAKIRTSSRRFEQRNFAMVWLHWTTLQVLYWCGAPPNWLARWYRQVRRNPG